jgi:hypothetical protein
VTVVVMVGRLRRDDPSDVFANAELASGFLVLAISMV